MYPGTTLSIGWWVEGLEKLEFLPDTTRLLWIGGNGSARVYRRAAAGLFLGVAYDAPDTLQKVGTAWRRHLGNGAYVEFDGNGLHRFTRNELGHVTSFYYAGTALDSITLPRPGSSAPFRSYRFRYTSTAVGPALDSIMAPSVDGHTRVVRTTRSANLQIDGLTDPDGYRMDFLSTAGRVDSIRNKRGDITRYRYNAAGGLKAVEASMTRTNEPPIVTVFRPAETLTADSSGRAILPLTKVYTLLDGPRSVGDTTMLFVNRWGAPDSVRDAAGSWQTVKRANLRFPAVVTTSTSATGFRQHAYHNVRGLIDSIVEVNPLDDGRNATTRFSWHSSWNRVTSKVAPTGEVETTSYDGSAPLALWTQPGNDATRRYTFAYNANRQIETVTPPGLGFGVMQRIDYDTDLGNVMRIKSPIGFITRMHKDSVGRNTLVLTPKDSLNGRSDAGLLLTGTQTFTTYDAMGRVDSTHVIGKFDGNSATRVLATRNTYDSTGNLTRLERYSTLALADVGPQFTEWTYDALGRAIAEIGSELVWETRKYDEAGNLDTVITRRGHTLVMTYDVLNRLRTKTVPSVTYGIRELEGTAAIPLDVGLKPFPWFPNDGEGGLAIPSATATFEYGPEGLTHASNDDAIVGRSYYRNGLLRDDTLIIRTLDRADSSKHVYVMGSSYDLSGRRIALRHPQHMTRGATADSVRYLYNSRGELASVVDLMGNTFTFDYDVRGNQVALNLPGGLVENSSYDWDDRLIRWRMNNRSGTPVSGQYAGAMLRDENLRLDGAGRVISTGDPQINNAMTAEYNGLGHLIRRQMEQLVTSNFGNTAGIKTVETFALDGLGNRIQRVSRDTAISENSDEQGRSDEDTRYEFSGRARATMFSHRTDTLVYDSTGNLVASIVDDYDLYGASPLLHDRVMYYDADQKLRYADSRRVQPIFDVFSELWLWKSHFEEYRYDPLGRRVLTYTRAECHVYAGWLCKEDAITRTVWDGSAELYEARMPTASNVIENDTLPINLGQLPNGAFIDPNPQYGRVAYTHGPRVDQPLSVTRFHYADQLNSNNATWASYPVFAVTPHWDWRGVATMGTMSNGGKWYCYAGRPCAEPKWLQQVWAFTQNSNDTLSPWFGSLVRDKQDATGLNYRRNRYLDGPAGRFTQQDPIGLAGGMNLYGFAGGDPVNSSDPFGLCPPCGPHSSIYLGLLGGRFTSPSNESKIASLEPGIQEVSRQFLNVSAMMGRPLAISEGRRSLETQTRYYAQGRTAPGPRITNAPPGMSAHNYGLAMDVYPSRNGAPNFGAAAADFAPIGALGQSFGFEWGGSWTSFKDRPHFEMLGGKTVQQLNDERTKKPQ